MKKWIIIGLTACCLPLQAMAAPMFAVEAFPVPGINSIAHGVGNDGTVVGFYQTNEYRGFHAQNGVTTLLPNTTLGGNYNKFIDVNNSQVATGRSLTAGFEFHTFLYDIPTATMTDIGTLGGANSFGEDINDSNEVVGFSATASGEFHAYLYTGDAMVDLGTLGGTGSNGWGINSAGVAVGDAALTGDIASHAFAYENGVMTDLGAAIPGGSSSAQSINDLGTAVGNADAPNGQKQAAIFENGVVALLGSLGGGASGANDINNSGWIVGESVDSAGQTRAFLYSDEFGILDLNDLTTNLASEFQVLTSAYDINESGQIVGTGIDINGVAASFSLTIVPVPAAGWLFLSALVGGLAAARRRTTG